MSGELVRARVDRVLEMHREGALSSRIARTTGLDVSKVDATIRKAGREPNVMKSYPTGRYGVDLPLPVAQVEELPPIPVHPTPAPQPVDEPEPTPEPTSAPEPLREEIVAQTPEPEPEASPMPKPPETVVANPHPHGRTHWSQEDIDQMLSLHRSGHGTAAIAEKLGRTSSAVKKMRAQHAPRTAFAKPAAAKSSAPQFEDFEYTPVTQPSGPVDFVSILDAQIADVEAKVASDQLTLELMRGLRSNLSRAA